MTKRRINNIFILTIFTMYMSYYKLFISRVDSTMGDFINVAAIVIIAFISIILLGYRKDRMTAMKKSILCTTITEILLCIIIIYGLGFIIGYNQNNNILNVNSILENFFVPAFYIVAIEIFRYTVLNANKDNKEMTYAITFLIILLEESMGLQNALMYNFETIFTNTATIIIPIIIKNATLSYLSMNGGLKPVLFYRLTIDMYMLIMPFTPNLGGYLTSVTGILLPAVIYMRSSKYSDRQNPVSIEEKNANKKAISWGEIPVIIIIVVLAVLISGKFKYAIIGIGSESMSPTIDKGDAVIYQKVKTIDDLKKGDILVFKSGSKMIIHRYIEKKEEKGTTYIVTKGDANNSSDNLNLTIKDVEGKVLFKIKYLAYPSLWLKETIENNS